MQKNDKQLHKVTGKKPELLTNLKDFSPQHAHSGYNRKMYACREF
jgi:hypothetical protein